MDVMVSTTTAVLFKDDDDAAVVVLSSSVVVQGGGDDTPMSVMGKSILSSSPASKKPMSSSMPWSSMSLAFMFMTSVDDDPKTPEITGPEGKLIMVSISFILNVVFVCEGCVDGWMVDVFGETGESLWAVGNRSAEDRENCRETR